METKEIEEKKDCSVCKDYYGNPVSFYYCIKKMTSTGLDATKTHQVTTYELRDIHLHNDWLCDDCIEKYLNKIALRTLIFGIPIVVGGILIAIKAENGGIIGGAIAVLGLITVGTALTIFFGDTEDYKDKAAISYFKSIYKKRGYKTFYTPEEYRKLNLT